MAWVMAVFYVAAGCAHILSPAGFVSITPGWVPYPHEVILATGLCEIAGGAALAWGPLRWWAGVMLALYAVAVFPANIKHFVDDVPLAGVHLSWWYHLPRLAFQPVLVWWAMFAGGAFDWPFRGDQRTP